MSALLVISVIANLCFYFNSPEITPNENLENQIESLTSELNLLNTTYNEYKEIYVYTSSEYEALNISYNTYQNMYTVLDEEYESLQNQYDSLSAIYENYALDHVYSNSEYNTIQTQIDTLQSQMETKNEQITTLQTEVQTLENQITAKDEQLVTLQTELDNTRISLEIEQLTWDTAADTATITIRNTGGVNVTIASISLQETTPEAPWITDTSPDATGWINSEETKDFVWDGAEVGFDLLDSTSYLVQVDYISIYALQYLDETPTS